MKQTTKSKKQEQAITKIIEQAQKEPVMMLDKYFPKGSKKRGSAMAILAVAFWSGKVAGQKIEELK